MKAKAGVQLRPDDPFQLDHILCSTSTLGRATAAVSPALFEFALLLDAWQPLQRVSFGGRGCRQRDGAL